MEATNQANGVTDIFNLIKRDLTPSPPTVGVWFQKLKFTKGIDGQKLWRSADRPVIEPEYAALFGLDRIENFPKKHITLVEKSHRRTVEEAISRARQDPNNSIHECTFKITPVDSATQKTFGTVKWLHARACKREYLGSTYLFCWNTDVTLSKEKELFYDQVLDTIPGFVFLKQWIPDDDSGTFRFKYCNKPLIRLLNRVDADWEGRTDFDYFSKEYASQFAANDLKAFSAGGQRIVIAEEEFQLKNSTSSPKILTTVKVRFDTINGRGQMENCVLGIAIDITSQMQLLKFAMEQCGEAIFLKDSHRRFVFANKNYRQMIGIENPVTRLEGTTFEEVQSCATGKRLSKRVRKLSLRIKEEDEQLLTGKETRIKAYEKSFLSDNKSWVIEKWRVGDSIDNYHIIGFARHQIDTKDIANSIIKRSPHSVCIKNEKLQVIYCNDQYAADRNLTINGCLGKTDADFWRDELFENQASRYEMEDKKALSKLEEQLAIEKSNLSEKKKRRKIKQLLEPFTLVDERVIFKSRDGKAVNRHLITSRWPDELNGQKILHVVYSDETNARLELKESILYNEQWHKYTIHALSNETGIIMNLREEFRQLIENADSTSCLVSRPKAIQIYSVLDRCLDGLSFYVENNLKLSKGEFQSVSGITIRDILEEQDNILKLALPDYIHYEGVDFIPSDNPFIVDGDRVFLRAAFTEMLRNSLKALRRRCFYGINEEFPKKRAGKLKIVCSLVNHFGSTNRSGVMVSVLDEGDGCVAGTIRNQRLDFEAKNNSAERDPNSTCFGLSFIRNVARLHKGVFKIELRTGSNVVVHLVIPIKRRT